ncbi:MAG TPA: VOC family protein [Pseudonocardiaceae bacterium]
MSHGRLRYMEIPAIDVEESAAFYEAVFGWKIRRETPSQPYFTDPSGQLDGTFVVERPASYDPGLLGYLQVDDLDETLAAVLAHGGEVIRAREPADASGVEHALIRDPGGNVFGLFQAPPGSPVDAAGALPTSP